MRKRTHRKKIYCPECVAGVAPYDPDEVLDENRPCACCLLPHICPNYCGTEERPLRELFCRECLDEMDAYIARIDKVSAEINAIIREREAGGWTPVNVLMDGTFTDSESRKALLRHEVTAELWDMPLSEVAVKLPPVPRLFALWVLSKKGTHAQVDFVSLAPSALKRFAQNSLRSVASELGLQFDGTLPS